MICDHLSDLLTNNSGRMKLWRKRVGVEIAVKSHKPRGITALHSAVALIWSQLESSRAEEHNKNRTIGPVGGQLFRGETQSLLEFGCASVTKPRQYDCGPRSGLDP